MVEINEFLKLTRKYNVVPVCKEILADLETPLSAYLKIDNPEYSFLLESIEGGEKIARYSFLSREPYEIFYYKEGIAYVVKQGKEKKIKTDNPFEELRKIFKKYNSAPLKGMPEFTGGAVGYIGYDVVKRYEKIPEIPKDDNLNWPDMFFMFVNILMVFDHITHKIIIINNVFIEKNDTKERLIKKYEKASRELDRIIKSLKKPLVLKSKKKIKTKFKIKCFTKKEEFKKNVAKLVKLIHNGEMIQTVLSQRFLVKYSGNPIDIYRSLRSINPSPYMHFLRMGEKIIIGASPELMVKVEDRQVILRPIAGTRKRGKNEYEDKKLEEELLNDEKEKAEHIMLVDLGRNDIGRVAEYGSVKVNELMKIERYSHVMHIVSEVKGKLRKDKDIFDVIKATFPAGTVTGAPKVRSMQLIEYMENIKRGPYAGAVGIISFSGNLETCISIRSIYMDKDKAYIQSGAGIVADSKPDKEYRETQNKARAMILAIKNAYDMEY